MKSLRGLAQTHAARLSCFHSLPCGFRNVPFLVLRGTDFTCVYHEWGPWFDSQAQTGG